MPAAVAIPAIAALAGAGISAGTSIAAGRRAARSTDRSGELESKAIAESLAFEREKEARRRQEFDQTELVRKQEYDAAETRRQLEYDRSESQMQAAWDAEQARQAPFRQARESAVGQIAANRGIAFTPSSAPSVRPPGWTGPMSAPASDVPLSQMISGSSGMPPGTLNTTMPVASGGAPLPRSDDMWLSELVAPRKRTR